MNTIRQVRGHEFPSGVDWPIARFGIGLNDIVALFAIERERWDEDGLGEASGAFVALPSGKVILIRELAHSKVLCGRYETDILADCGDFVASGDDLIDEAIAALGVPRDSIAWRAGADSRASAADLLERAQRFRATRNPPT